MRTRILAVLLIGGLLAGCASTPSVPYWENPQWINKLGEAVHNGMHYSPVGVASNLPSGTAVIVFTYDNGRLRSPSILRSTGSTILDSAILEQLLKIRPPMAQGLENKIPHTFQMAVEMHDANLDLFKDIAKDLQSHIYYPRRALLSGASGIVVIGFKYRNGRVSDATIKTSSGYSSLDRAALHEVQALTFPEPPPALSNQTFSLELPFCFGLNHNSPCPRYKVSYVPKDVTAPSPAPRCAQIGYIYRDGIMSNIRIIQSSGNLQFDRQALAEVIQAKFPHPEGYWDRATSSYKFPVCSNNLSNLRVAEHHPL